MRSAKKRFKTGMGASSCASSGFGEKSVVAARVHDDVLLASGEPPAFKQRQHLAARLVDVDDAAAIGDASIVLWPS